MTVSLPSMSASVTMPVTFEAAENAIRVQTDVANKLLTSSSKELFDQHYETLALTMADLERSEIVGRARHAIHQLLPSGGVTEEKIGELCCLASGEPCCDDGVCPIEAA